MLCRFIAGCLICVNMLLGCAAQGVKFVDNSRGYVPLSDGSQLRITKIVPAEYPRDIRRAGIEGVVFVQLSIQPDGTPANVSIRQSSHPALNEYALKAVSDWRFEPYDAATRSAGNVIVPVRFKLDRE